MIKAIFAVDLNGGMGKDGTLPWPHDKQDMEWFSSNTRGHVVVMGSKTWLDPKMPKPLPDRHCAVVTNQSVENFPKAHDVIAGAAIEQSLEVLQLQHPKKDIWIIGGPKLIESTSHLFKQLYLTTFYDEFNCDVRIDVVELLKSFNMQYESYGKNKIFSVWTRRAKLQ
jgi:dihydrofolate reductase